MGKLGASSSDDDTIISSTADKLNITNEEARKIVDYTIEEEKILEKRTLNQQKKAELLASWETESRMAEERVENELSLASSSADLDSQSARQRIIDNDTITREILSNDEERRAADALQEKQRAELDFYQRQLQQRKDVEFSTSGDDEDVVDIDTMYENTLNVIQSSRKMKLGPKSLGVLSNSIALEEGREYVIKQKEQRDFLRDVEKEAGLENASDEEVGLFFRAPINVVEERMYRNIVRQIVDNKRVVVEDEKEDNISSSSTSYTEDDDDDDESAETLDAAEEGWDGPSYGSSSAKKKQSNNYQLSAKETVEAYKLLNLWREVQSTQDAMEIALGMKDDDTSYANTRPKNKLEPYFLYQEDTEEKRLKEKESLSKVLQKGLASDDDVERSSNELLMKELLEGGITKDRSVRLLDKLLNKATDDTIRESLMELRGTLLEDDDDWNNEEDEDQRRQSTTAAFLRKKKKKKSGQPIDLSGVFRTSDMEEDEDETMSATSTATPSTSSDVVKSSSERTMPSWVSEEETPPPSTPFFSSSNDVGDDDEQMTSSLPPPPLPNTPFFSSTDKEVSQDEKTTTGGMFGTYEEQRLQKLANKVGAETEEEIEELKRNMEGKNR